MKKELRRQWRRVRNIWRQIGLSETLALLAITWRSTSQPVWPILTRKS